MIIIYRINESIVSNNLQNSIIAAVESKNQSLNDVLSLLRCIYNEFNIRINYDYTWLYDSNFDMEKNFDYDVTFCDLINTKLSCNAWCKLYKELLLMFGFSIDDILIKSEKLKHKWIEIDLKKYNIDKIIKIDGTTNYYLNQDIYNCKVGNNTSGFLLFDRNTKSYSIEHLYSNKKLNSTDIEIQGNMFHKLDNKLGFHGIDVFEALKSVTASNSTDVILTKIYAVLSKFSKNNGNLVVNGSDLVKFLRHGLQTTELEVEFLAYYKQEYIETCCKIGYQDSFLFYSENEVVLLNNNRDYDNYISGINFVKKKSIM